MVQLVKGQARLAPGFAALVFFSALTLLLSESVAQQNDRRAAISKFLLEPFDWDRTHLPGPSRASPSYWGLAENVRTPADCGGDLAIGTHIVNLFKSRKRGEVVSHGGGFYSASLSKSDENAVDIIGLPPGERDLLRSLLKVIVRDIERSEEGRTWTFRLVGIPELVVNFYLAILLFGADFLAEKTMGNTADVVKTRLLILADQLQSPTQLYRSVAVVKSKSGREYVRYLYAVVPNDRDASILRACYYVRDSQTTGPGLRLP